MKPQTIVRLALLAAALLIVALVQVVKSIDVDQYRGAASGWVKRQSGRDLAFDGPLSLKLSVRPALVADGVRLLDGNRHEMVKLGHVEAQIGLLPLLSGQVQISRIWVDGAEIKLESDGHGHGNWEFAAPAAVPDGETGEFPATTLRITQIALDHVSVRLDEHLMAIEHMTLDSDSATAPMALTLDGLWDGRHLGVNGILGSQKELLSGEKPYPVQAKILLPGTVASLQGSLKGDPQLGLTTVLSLAIEVSDSADLDPLLGIPLPSLGSARAAITLTGRVDRPRIDTLDATIGRHDSLAISFKGAIDDPIEVSGVELALTADGDAAAAMGVTGQTGAIPVAFSGHVSSNGMGNERGWRIGDLKGSLGRSDLNGQLTLRRRNGHGVIDGRFESGVIDLAQSQEAGEPHQASNDPRLLSDQPLPLRFFLESEGHIAWHVGKLTVRRLDASGVSLDLGWHDGKMAADAVLNAVAGGRIEGHFAVDGSVKPSGVAIDLSLAHVVAGDLLSALAWSDAVAGGRTDFRFKASASGDSPRAIFASLQGSSLLSMAPTTLSNKLAQDGLGSILAQLSSTIDGPSTELRCLISHFTMMDGLARSEALLFALGPTLVTGQGSVNLGNENLDFTLTPRPTGQASTPLEVAGSMAHPQVALSKGAIVRNLPAVNGDADNPPFAFTGTEPCYGALAQARKIRGAR